MMYGFSIGFARGRPPAGTAPGTTPTPTPGPVQSASIEQDGTVLALIISGVSAGSWEAYGINAPSDTMPGVQLATVTAGYDRISGQAVANAARARPLIALKPCRKTPIAPSSVMQPNSKVLDEVDHGDGTRTVRLRLSQHVYQGDACTLSLAAGWRNGAPAQSGIAVTNGSTRPAAPVVGGRWLTPPKQRVTGSFRVDVMAGSINPEGRSGLAAVRFDVTDGTTTKSVWAVGLSTSTAYGDSVRCWGADIDPSGLNLGLITVHKTLFPWVGASRTSGSGQSAAAGSFVNTADAPLVMAYDPAGTRYAEAWVMCDPVNGTTTASAAMVQSSLAAAKAVAPASKPASITTAMQAVYLSNRAAAAANGQAALTRMADNAIVVVPAGVTPIAGSAITTGFTATECWPIVMGDPADANPRANCIVAGGATAPTWRMTHLNLRDVTLRLAGGAVAPPQSWLHNVQVEAAGGSEGTNGFLSTSAASWLYATGSAIGASLTSVSFQQAGSANRFALVRSCTTPRSITALAIVNCSARGYNGWVNIGDADSQADWVLANCSLPSANGNTGISWPYITADGYRQHVRPLVLNVLMERIGTEGQPFWQQGENQFARYTHAVIEGVSAVGQRTNTLYNDPGDLTSHNAHVDCRVANCFFDWMPTKQDDYADDANPSNNGAPNYSYRPWLTDNLWFQDGTNCEGNVHARRVGAGDFAQHGVGRRGVINPSSSTTQGNAWTKFIHDRSALGVDGGGGDYRPASGSPLIGVAVNANLDVDRAGVARGATFAAGALEAT